MHRVIVEQIVWTPGEVAVITGDEAHHALRVKRIRAGENVQLMDGRGGIAEGTVMDGPRDRTLHIHLTAVRREDPARPRIEVWSAVPKGGRVDEMIDQLAQIGAAQWRPLDTTRSIVDPREAKMERLTRIAAEASKQCGRAWTMEIGTKATFEQAIRGDDHTTIILADASGLPRASGAPRPLPRSSGGGAGGFATAEGVVPRPLETLRLLIGPEGGWTPDELTAARAANITIARFGPHIMRIETAAVAACAALMIAPASA